MDAKLDTYLSLTRFSGAEELARPSTEPKHFSRQMMASQNRGAFFGGTHNKNCSSVVSILGSPYLGKLPNALGLGNFLSCPIPKA